MPEIKVYLEKDDEQVMLLTRYYLPTPSMSAEQYKITMNHDPQGNIYLTYKEKPDYELNKTFEEITKLEMEIMHLRKKAWELQQ